MKRSTGLLCAGLALLGLALSASATTYTGAGSWKSTDGTSGDYTVDANIEAIDDNSVTIEQTLDFGNKTLDINLIIQKRDDTFFNVINADTNEQIGEGYCFTYEETKLCHSDSFTGEYYIESTIKLTPTSIYRLGSKTNAFNGDKIIWNDKLDPQAVEPPVVLPPSEA